MHTFDGRPRDEMSDAIDRTLRKVRNDALEEAAQIAGGYGVAKETDSEATIAFRFGCRCVAAAIRARMEDSNG